MEDANRALRQSGKELYRNGRLSYEGETLNGVRDGYGVRYDRNEALIYRGTWRLGKRDGAGHVYSKFTGAVEYYGQFANDLYHGTGSLYYHTGVLRYVGGWDTGKRSGEGQQFSKTGSRLYRGQFRDDKRHGVGTTFFDSGASQYEGHWVQGKRHGLGKSWNADGELIYEGEWNHNRPIGKICVVKLGNEKAEVVRSQDGASLGFISVYDATCPVCFEVFDDVTRRVVQLGCGHFYCETCVPRISSCPFDRLTILRWWYVPLHTHLAKKRLPDP